MKEFIKMFFASLAAMAMVCFGGFILMVIFVGVVSTFQTPEPVVEKGSVLVFDMSANIQDRPVSMTQEQFIGDVLGRGGVPNYSLRALLNAIESAADDTRIEALYLKGSLQSKNYGSGFAALKEVREAIQSFKEVSEKPVIANLVYPSDKDIYLASVADKIIMNPEGLIMSAGMASEPMYYAGFFKKYGIGVQVTKAGEYKSAAETFVLEKMSAPARVATKALLDDLWSEYVDVVSTRAGMSKREFQALVNSTGLLNAKDAMEAGIVDELGFSDSVIRELKEVSGSESEKLEFESISMNEYMLANQEIQSGDHIAVVYAEGAIVVGEGGDGQIGGSRLAREIREIRQDEEVKAIVLRVNSPGGSALASEVIQHELRLANENIPVIVSMGTVAASGGYWISAYADKIYAEPNTITGSIGVIGMFMNFKEIANNHGFTFDVVKTGKFADALSATRPKSTEEMAIVQREVDNVYSDFLRKVAEGRNQPAEHIAKIAEGRVWSGIDALELGLVDEMGGLEDAIAYAAEIAGLGEDPSIRDYPQVKNFFDELKENLNLNTSVRHSSPILDMIESTIDEIQSVSQFNDPKGVYAVLPYRIEAN
jgi:protease-4